MLQLDLSRNQLCDVNKYGQGTFTAEGITAIADALHVNSALTVTNLLHTQLDAESAKMLAEVAKQKGISLCGIQRDQTIADFSRSRQGLTPPNAILLASDLSQAFVTGGLTALDLSFEDRLHQGCNLADEGVSAVCEAIQSNKESKLASLNFGNNDISPVGANAVAAMVAVTGALTKLSLAKNKLEEEGTKTICEALEQNKTLKELDVRSNNIAGDGAEQISATVLGNLKIEMFNEIPVKEMRANSLTELDLNGKGVGVEGVMVVAGLIPVMGGLTSIDLSNNQLCGVWTDYHGQHGTYTAEGITAIADAVRVNGGLTKLSLAKNKLGEEGTKFLCDALVGNNTLKELDLSGDISNSGSNIGGTAGAKHVANMLLVNGGLTSIDLSGNQLCGVWTDDHGQHGTYTAEGITAIADAMRVNGTLTQVLVFRSPWISLFCSLTLALL